MSNSYQSASERIREIAENAYRKAVAYGLTDDEALAAALTHENSWCPCRHKLMREGKVVPTDKTRVTRAGRTAMVYIFNE